MMILVMVTIVVISGISVEMAAAVVRNPHAFLYVVEMSGMPIAMAVSAAVVVDRPTAIDPRSDGDGVVMAAAVAMVAVATYRNVTVMMAIVVVEDGSNDQSSDDPANEGSTFAVGLGGRGGGGS